jgi:uncharacterized protein (TIGR02996 family)
MDMEPALLQAVHEAPNDEAPWLVLADWLEDDTQAERAELLRLSLALRSHPEGPRRSEAEGRLQELLAHGVRPCVASLTNSIGMRLAVIPAGKFFMGTDDPALVEYEGPRHEVELTRAFYLGVVPVTQEQYQRVTGESPSAFSARGEDRDKVRGRKTHNFPVEMVSWQDPFEFCRQLSKLPEEAQAKRRYRLPTEAEWEYACRAGTTTLYSFGAGSANAERYGWHEGNSDGRTRPVGAKLPNAWGLMDMLGNVWEWCRDWNQKGLPGQGASRKDPTGPATGRSRSLRGLSYGNNASDCRSTARNSLRPDQRYNFTGFRVVMQLGR